MVRGWHYTKLSASSALLLSFSGVCFVLLFLSFVLFFSCFCFVLLSSYYSRWSFVDVIIIIISIISAHT